MITIKKCQHFTTNIPKQSVSNLIYLTGILEPILWKLMQYAQPRKPGSLLPLVCEGSGESDLRGWLTCEVGCTMPSTMQCHFSFPPQYTYYVKETDKTFKCLDTYHKKA